MNSGTSNNPPRPGICTAASRCQGTILDPAVVADLNSAQAYALDALNWAEQNCHLIQIDHFYKEGAFFDEYEHQRAIHALRDHIAHGKPFTHEAMSLFNQYLAAYKTIASNAPIAGNPSGCPAPDNSRSRSAPPIWGERVLCVLVPPVKQEEMLGDMAERFAKTWLPRFGARGAALVYAWHALWLGQRLWRSAMICAAVDWFVRKIGL